VEFLEPAVGEMALALDNALHHHQVVVYQKELQEALDRCRLLREISDTVVGNLNLRELFTSISVALRTIIHHDYASLMLLRGRDPAGGGRSSDNWALTFFCAYKRPPCRKYGSLFKVNSAL
jgi:hypothetical protein